MMYIDMHAYFRLMENRMKQLEDRLAMLENQSEQLARGLQQVKPIHIENITYKVQELAVHDLSGTLNIGLTALSDPEQLEKWVKLKDNDEGQELHAENLSQSAAKEGS